MNWINSFRCGLFITVCVLIQAYTSVHITNLEVPRTYVLERDEFLAAFSPSSSNLHHPPSEQHPVGQNEPSTTTTSTTTTHPLSSVPSTDSSSLSPDSTANYYYYHHDDGGDISGGGGSSSSSNGTGTGSQITGLPPAAMKPLIMDCQYEIKANECGFVLKWYFNRKLIYQWIPSRSPIGMNKFKSELWTNYSMSDSANYKYRALVIQHPKLNHSGEYMCSVQTYESFDRKAARFQIIVPEKMLLLHYENDAEKENMLLIKCSVFMIYPEPNLVLVVSGDLLLVSSRTVVLSDRHHMYNKTIYGLIDKHLLISPTSIGCILTVAGSSYVRKRETIYYDPTQLTRWSHLRMDQRGHFEISDNSVDALRDQSNVIAIVMVNIILGIVSQLSF
ncbi:uncharacterized protein LOC129747324 [Uranotaenia lowii]|uniref:uncharacterized protein LOC129747324 n=1 Tax=Uranotaenia lowii TaxID=190385 RepID=UPI002478DC17|nr:uncharacterized protein LOC129747324 [Uranotaenia lowii]